MTGDRRPFVHAQADGTDIRNIVAAEVTSVSHFDADKFSLQVASQQGLGDWADRTNTLIDISFGVDGTVSRFITGRIDTLIANPISGTVTIEGRDLSAGLIQSRSHETFANQTASDIATLLATRQGLTAAVTATENVVGRFYGVDHTHITLDRLSRASTEWDLLVLLAQQEGFDVFVFGTTLYFQPPLSADKPVLTLRPSLDSTGSANVTSIRLQRRMTLAGDITVTVKSWNTQSQQAISEVVTRTGSGGPACGYNYVRPNLTVNDALLLAERKLASVVRHEVVLDATMPGELALAPRMTIGLRGTASLFDTQYVVDEVTRRFSIREGFGQTVRAHRLECLGGI